MVNKWTCSFYQWEHEQICQGNLGSKWILGSNLEFLLEEQSKTFLGITEILEICLGSTEHRPPWEPLLTIFYLQQLCLKNSMVMSLKIEMSS